MSSNKNERFQIVRDGSCGSNMLWAALARLKTSAPSWAPVLVAVVGFLLIPGAWSVAASGKSFMGLTSLNPVAGPGEELPAAGMASMHGMPADMPMPPGMADMNMINPNQPLLDYVLAHHKDERYVMAVPTANTASPYLARGLNVIAMGGFTGSTPSPSTSDLETLVAAHELRYVMVGGFHGIMGGATAQKREAWVREHCVELDTRLYSGPEGPSGPPGHAETLFDCAASPAVSQAPN